MESNIVSIFERDNFKVEYRQCFTTKGKKMYGGIVYYKSKFIKFIPYNNNAKLTEKYLKMLVDKYIIKDNGIYITCRDGSLQVYYYFNPSLIYD